MHFADSDADADSDALLILNHSMKLILMQMLTQKKMLIQILSYL